MTALHDDNARALRRADEAMVRLGVLVEDERKRTKLRDRAELFLWQLVFKRWTDVHRFFESVEPVEAQKLIGATYTPGNVFAFFSERQDEREFENMLVVGIALVFAAMRRAQERGLDATRAGTFELQRMLAGVIDEVDGAEALLAIGSPG